MVAVLPFPATLKVSLICAICFFGGPELIKMGPEDVSKLPGRHKFLTNTWKTTNLCYHVPNHKKNLFDIEGIMF